MTPSTSSTGDSPWRDRLGRGLMWLLAVSALGAFFSGVASVRAASPDRIWVETWRMFGFLVFVAMFAICVAWPRGAAGLWELGSCHKAAMAVAALFLTSAAEARQAGLIDGILAAVIAVSYVCTRGWRSWASRGSA